MSDLFNNSIPDSYFFNIDTTLVIGILLMVILFVLTIYFHRKFDYFLVILVLFLFSLVIGYYLFTDEVFIQYDYLEYFIVCFLLVQTIIFIITCIEFYEK